MRSVKLGDILDVQSGFAFKTEFFSEIDGIPLIRIRDLLNTSTETNYRGEFRKDFIVESGDYLIGMDGNFRCYRWQGPIALLNQRVCRLRNFKPDVDPEYIYHGIQKKLQDIEAATPFATVKHISARQIQNIELPFPSLDQQHRIADILSRAEGIVRLRREAQKKAQELIPALFLDMFGDPATNPKGWPVATIGEVIESTDYGSSKKASGDNIGLPLIRMGNVDYTGYLDLSDLKYVDLLPEEVEQYRLYKGDVLFNRTNSKELVGKTGLWNGSCEAVAASYFIRMRVIINRLNPFYLWAFMNTAHMKRVLFETARGAIGQANINARELRSFRIGIPLLALQNTFEQHCRDVFSIQSQQSIALEKAEATFQSLLHRAFAGQL
ncbi:MAG: restriction endonuclease subunit S [Candidatus Contendobacter sp.]|nr:restriction endonuclease subunit S [Candidatus Contendobacter sp.]